MPMAMALFFSAAAMNSSGLTFLPKSITLKPLALSIRQTRFLPMSCVLPRTRPTMTVPVGHWQESRSEEHTSELQSHSDLVCRLLLEKKKKTNVRTDSIGCVTCTLYHVIR